MPSYTLFSQQAPTGTSAGSGNYVLTAQFSVSSSATLSAIWFYSGAGSTSLPPTIGIFQVSTQTLVHSETAVWNGALGSGWVRATFTSPPSLTSGVAYKGGVANPDTGAWYTSTPHYWDTGAGSGGVSNGILSAPNNANASPGQDSFQPYTSGVLPYPSNTFNANNYWVDVEVAPGAGNVVTVTNPGNQTSRVTQAVSLQLQATDSQSGQTFTWSETGLPPGLGVNQQTGVIVGKPTTPGTYNVTVTATDTTNASGSASFTWTVVLAGTTSRSIVRAGVAQFFGGTTFDSTFRAYRTGPLNAYGLSTVRAYQPKRLPDLDYVLGQAPGRGMGAVMILEMNETRDNPVTVSQFPVPQGGRRELVYPIQCHVFHLAHMDFAEDAEADVDALDQAIHEQIYSDPTLGGICYQAGLDKFGIRSLFDQPEIWEEDEILLTHFRVLFDVQVQILAQ